MKSKRLKSTDVTPYQLVRLLEKLPESSYDKFLQFVEDEMKELLLTGRMGMPWESLPPEERKAEVDNDTD